MKLKFIMFLMLGLLAFVPFKDLQAQCLPTTISSSHGDPIMTCPGDGLADRVFFRPNTFATLYVFVVTDTNNIILNSFLGTITDFENAGIGVCRVYGVSFAGVLDLSPGNNLFDHDVTDFCYTISSNYITVIRGGENTSMVQTTNGETTVSTCPGDGNPDLIDFENTGDSPGDNFTFVLTDENDVVLGIPEGNQVDFEDAGIGQCRVYGLSYDGDLALLVGDTLRADDFVIGCETGLSNNYVTIDRTGLNGGTVATTDGENLVSTCVGDGIADIITFASMDASIDESFTYIVTDANNIVLGIPAGNAQDFDGAGLGNCKVFGLSYSGDLLVQAGDDLETTTLSTNCSALSSNFIEVVRLNIDGGTISTSAGDSLVYICPGDGIANIVEFSSQGASNSGNFTYIVTTDENVILGIPAGNTQDFDGAGIGTCRVYGLNYLGDLLISAGDTLGLQESSNNCSNLSSNYIEVVRNIAEAGTVSLENGETSIRLCIGDGEPNFLTFANEGATNVPFTYIVTDADGIVLGIPPANSVDFELAGVGTCLVYGLSYTGHLSVEPGDTLANINLSDDCYDLSDQAVVVTRVAVNGGTITDNTGDTLIYTCPADGLSNIIHFTSTGAADNADFTYIVTDANDVILGIPPADSVDFEPAGFGACRVYGLSYLGDLTAMPGDTVGISILSNDCFDVSSDYLTVIRDIAEAGNIELLIGGNEITLCAGDGTPDIVTFTGSGASAADFTYVVTDADGVVLGIPPTDSVDFEGAGPGACLVYGISFTGNLTVMIGDTLSNVALSDDCYNLSNNSVTVIRQDAGNPGIVSTTAGETEVSVIVGDGELSILEFQNTAVGGENFTYIVTNDNLEILGIPPGNAVDFENAGVGVCRVYGVTYSGDLLAATGDTLGVNALVNGCFNLSDNYVTVTRTEDLSLVADSVFTIAGQTVVFTCPGDDIADEFTFMTDTISADAGFTYIVTDDQNMVLGIPSGDTQDFEGAGLGACRVYGLVFTGNLVVVPGNTLGAGDLSDGEYILSPNYVTVNRDIPNGGSLSGNVTDTVYACVNDGVADEFIFDVTNGSNSLHALIVLDSDGVILDIPEGNTIDFEGAGEGTCFVFNMGYTGNILLEVGDTLALVPNYTDDCFDLTETFITVIRTPVNGGAVATTDSLTSLSIFVNDGVANEISFINEGIEGENFSYIVTDDANIILGIPSGDTQDFEGAGEGACRVYGVSYSGTLTASMGDTLGTVDLADDCFDLSDNFVTVTRIDSSGNFAPSDISTNRFGTINVPVTDLALSPNPAYTQTKVAFKAATAQTVTLQVFNVTGNLVHQQKIQTTAGQNNLNLEISDWNEGIYFVRLADGQGTNPVRFVKL